MGLARGFLVGFYAVVYVLSQLVDTLEDMEREAEASMDVMLISWQIYLARILSRFDGSMLFFDIIE